MDPFYVVMRDDAQTVINVRHPSEAEATAEATRLCQKTGKRFIVLKVIGCVEVALLPTKWVPADGASGEE